MSSAGTPRIVFTPGQEAALARVRYALESPAGVVLLCGVAGTGTSLLLAALARKHGEATGGRIWSVGQLATGSGMVARLPQVVLVDDAHLATGDELAAIAALAPAGEARCVVLGGRGRLLTLVGRDSRIAARIRLRAVVPPFTLDDTRRLVRDRLGRGIAEGEGEGVILRIHEITAGAPAGVARLVDLALAASSGGRLLSADDVETIHRRLDPLAV